MSRRATTGRALLLIAVLALAAWGLTVTLPHLGEAEPGYLAKGLYPVLVWSVLAVACVAGLVYLLTRR